MWLTLTKTAAATTRTFFYDGTTETSGADLQTVSNHASFISTPENLVFGGAAAAVVFPVYKLQHNTYILRRLAVLHTSNTSGMQRYSR